MGEAVPVLFPDVPPLFRSHDAVNERIVLPLSAPGVNATEIDALPRVTLVMVGASGAAAGTTGDDGSDALLVPTALVAVTVQVYVLPLVRLLTVTGDAAPVWLPGVPPSSDEQLAEKLVIALPLSAPGVNATETEALPPVALVIVGWPGAAAGR